MGRSPAGGDESSADDADNPTRMQRRPLQFRVLGPLGVAGVAGDPLPLGGAKMRTVLAALLANANRVTTVGSLVEAVWEDDVTDTAEATLQVYVSTLRRLLTEQAGRNLIVRKGPGYLLDTTGCWFDLDEFR